MMRGGKSLLNVTENGVTAGARNEIFALWPAPVQTSYMGFPATTGASFLPYLITDKVNLFAILHIFKSFFRFR